MIYQDKSLEELIAILDSYDKWYQETFKKPISKEDLNKMFEDLLKEKVEQDFRSRFKTLTANNILQAKQLIMTTEVKKLTNISENANENQSHLERVKLNESEPKKSKRKAKQDLA